MIKNTTVTYKTKETDITVTIFSDKTIIKTGIGFFDHMLSALALHSGIGMAICCEGDLCVDCHHSVEDVGIALGRAFLKAMDGDYSGLARYGEAAVPMDEALCRATLDLSKRPFLVFNGEFTSDKIGEMDTQMVKEFFRAFAFNALLTLHIDIAYGENDHHKAEAAFKAVARALKNAIVGIDGTLSTKGAL